MSEKYIATPAESICGQHSIVISKPAERLVAPAPQPLAEPAIYVVGPVKTMVETRASEVLTRLNQ